MRNVQGRVAVVTGAASGIGRATSVELGRKGCELALVDVNEEAMQETRALLAAAGVRASTHIVDVADRARMEALPAAVLAAHGRVDLLVNNAGVSVCSDVLDHDMDDFAWVVGINLWGVVHGCRFFLPHLLAAPEAHIVNVSSLCGIIALPSKSAYSATKFAVRGFTEALRCELLGTKVGVTCAYPGIVRTNIYRDSRNKKGEPKSEAPDVGAHAMEPSEAARLLVRGIEKSSARVLMGVETHAVNTLTRVFPVLVGDVLTRNRARYGL